MSRLPERLGVVLPAMAAGAQVVVTANTAHLRSARRRLKAGPPCSTLASLLLAVLDALDRNEALRPFVEVARNRLL